MSDDLQGLAINDAQSSLIRVLVRRAKRRHRARDRIRQNNGWPPGEGDL